MSALRYKVCWKKIESGKVTKSFKLCSLPPTKEAFEQNVLRAHFNCAVVMSSLESSPPPLDPTDFGYSKVEAGQCLQPVMLPNHVQVAPEEILRRLSCHCSAKNCSRNPVTLKSSCSCVKTGMHCTTFCKCNHDLCENKDDVSEDEDEHEATEVDHDFSPDTI